MSKFEFIKEYENARLRLPSRATANAAGYDFEVAEDILIPSYWSLADRLKTYNGFNDNALTLDKAANIIKAASAKPTLVPTGVKCQLAPFEYLELSVRSSLPLKHWLILANGVGIVDSDYYNNTSNEGHIYFQLINLAPFDIQLKKGDRIGQGIIRHYGLIDGDKYNQGDSRTGGFGSTSGFISLNAPYIIGDTETTISIEPHYTTTTDTKEDKYYQITFDDIIKTK